MQQKLTGENASLSNIQTDSLLGELVRNPYKLPLQTAHPLQKCFLDES